MKGTVVGRREQAASAARDAAARAGVDVRSLGSMPEFEAASVLVSKVWNDDGVPKAPSEFLRALAYAGNFVAGAFARDELVGFSVGFFGQDETELMIHSHITGISPDRQSKTVGFALKQFQRAWALQHDIEVVSWTTDPLVRRNAFFNLAKLGATMVAYHDDFYGRMNDGLNAGEESDRVLVRWDLSSERATLASVGALGETQKGDGALLLSGGDDGAPQPHEADGSVLHAWIPPDIVDLRHRDPGLARSWRLALRDVLGPALSQGYRAEAMTRDGWYVLTR